ncbi:molecular chaperone HtpG [Limimonas halophila]|uniref:Chaperone protein HtpG n=1 Tax=Limimonas halophila TaxID=1082479 RepID=A0A1G7LG56_9PROT|nr:molecular chaperone HtpG [Limimonas halophila]SDF48458.1 molecular chaperone HtpG [Limimonas halophila]
MSTETLNFQAEVSRLLDIVANSLYSNKEVFLRELVSNGSDACDRLRYAAITQPELVADDPNYRISLVPDAENRQLTIADNGIGMNRDDLVENLGTIARSGTLDVMNQLQQAQDENEKVNLIGQFGVGFYAAFVVADWIEVRSRKAGESQGWRWASDGRGTFTVEETDDAPARGTRVTLHLKEGEDEFTESERIKHVVKRHSDHIAIPIFLGEDEGAEQINTASALWTRPKSEITDEQYTEFYRHVSHQMDEPWMRLHFKAEGKVEFTCLLFIPSTKPFDLFDPQRKHGVNLYVRRVFVTDDCAELLPAYLRFLRGVVDSEDLPLNISREMLQHNPMVQKIHQTTVNRVLNELKKKANKEPESYQTFWETFGPVLKEGLYEDPQQKDSLLELARFRSSERDGWISLDDYVQNMKEGQQAIYVLTGDSIEALRKSPQLEGFKAKGVEVLLLADPIDDFWVPSIGEYQGYTLKPVTQGAAELDSIKSGEDDEQQERSDEEKTSDAAIGTLVAYLKTALEGQIKDVRSTERLTESACCLVADEGDMDIHLERLLRQHGRMDQSSQRILEVNPKHPLIARLSERVSGSDNGGGASPEIKEAAHLLLDQARIVEGETPEDPAAFARRMSDLVAKGLQTGPVQGTATAATASTGDEAEAAS